MSGVEIHTNLSAPLRFGATVHENGVHFAIFSRHATKVWLVLIDQPEDPKPSLEIELTPDRHRWGDVWHVFIENLQPGQLYLYRMDGPDETENGHHFNAQKYLLDPYARAITSHFPWKAQKALERDPWPVEFAQLPKCIVVDDDFDWEDDRPLNRPLHETIIYETHVRSLTVHPSSEAEHPGTFRGVIEMIPYFKELGITAVELMPVHEFNELETDRYNPENGERLVNLWGYSTVGFFAPNGRYCSMGDMGQQVREFKEMVRELHKAGIEVILDVVFNHTAEGGANGPTISFRGIDNSIYYLLDKKKKEYFNYSGCGNTLNCNHPIVRDLILNCLYYWVLEMHVDGFRFDLASILGRDQHGELMENPPLLEHIAEDPFLRDIKLIAEAWDLGGAYQVGSFPGERWCEWNGRFRDDVRRYWCGEEGMFRHLATRLAGSADLYSAGGKNPRNSINFVTSHDGFTLNDLVSYEKKHNLINAEDNRDGGDWDFSSNYGIEGPTHDPVIEATRIRQIKNFLGTLFLSQGVPMLLGGDEFRRTQLGNNNAYCQDNEISWYDWSLKADHAEIYRFCRELIAFRKRHPVFYRTCFFTGKDTDMNLVPDIAWYSANGRVMKWSEEKNYCLSCLIDGSASEIGWEVDDNDVYMMFNADTNAHRFVIPPAPHKKVWCIAMDTSRPSPYDIWLCGEEPVLETEHQYTVNARSMVVLLAYER